jgi:hypothetical protein
MYAQPAPRTRPTAVTVSSYLLYVTAAVSLISAVLSLSQLGTITDVYRDAYAGTSGEGAEALIVATSVIGVVFNILFAAGLAILAVFNNRGRQGARITTWVVGGISLCCSGIGVAGTALTSSMNFDTGNGPSATQVEQRLADALPSWYTPTTVVLSVVSLLSILGAIILLALPASNAYFRPAQPAWDPSMPYPYPGQAPYPGQVQYPGQYTGQPQYPAQYPPPYPEQPYPPPQPGWSAPPPNRGDQPPHTGSVPPTDPWSPPDGEKRDDRPPADPPA